MIKWLNKIIRKVKGLFTKQRATFELFSGNRHIGTYNNYNTAMEMAESHAPRGENDGWTIRIDGHTRENITLQNNVRIVGTNTEVASGRVDNTETRFATGMIIDDEPLYFGDRIYLRQDGVSIDYERVEEEKQKRQYKEKLEKVGVRDESI